MDILTETEYLEARKKYEEHETAQREWLKENKTNAIPCEVAEKLPYAQFINDDLRSAIETYDFIYNPPDSYFLYIDEENRKATTWIGQVLGSVVFGKEYGTNFSDTRVPVWIHAINGKRYYGTFYKSAGDYARIKIMKTRGGTLK